MMSGTYERLCLLGSGTFGEAWLCRHHVSGRMSVVKAVAVVAMSERDRQQALTEVSVLARCRHINVIRYRDAYISKSTLNIVMEYAQKGDLNQQITERKGDYFSEEVILDWFAQICFALRHIHGLHILHRDLKPKNIFLTDEDVIKVGDFGIARVLSSTDGHANTIIGTPYYISPEICQKQAYNYKSDMWAAGCILYELCSLKHPFEAPDIGTLMVKILHCQYKPIPSKYGALLEDLVSVLLKVESDSRPSADQVLRVPALQPTVATYVQRVARERGTGIDSPRISAPTPANTPDASPSTSVDSRNSSPADSPQIPPSSIHRPLQGIHQSGSLSRPRKHHRTPETRIFPKKHPLAVRPTNTPSPDVEKLNIQKTASGSVKKPTPTSQKAPRVPHSGGKENMVPSSGKRRKSYISPKTEAIIKRQKLASSPTVKKKETPKLSLYKEVLRKRQSVSDSPTTDKTDATEQTSVVSSSGTVKKSVVPSTSRSKPVNSDTYVTKKYKQMSSPLNLIPPLQAIDANGTTDLLYETTCASPSLAFDKLECLRMRLEDRMGSQNLLNAHTMVRNSLQRGEEVSKVRDMLGPSLTGHLPLILQLIQLEALAKL